MGFAVSCIYRPSELAMVNLCQVSIHLQPHCEFLEHLRNTFGADLPEPESVILGTVAQTMVALFPNAARFTFVGHVRQTAATLGLQLSSELHFQSKRMGRPKRPAVQCFFSHFNLEDNK